MKALLNIIVVAAAATIPLVAGHMTTPGPCASIGYPNSCCPPGADCRVTVPGGRCACSADCHRHGDCCSDVSCPRGELIILYDAGVSLLNTRKVNIESAIQHKK